ncbi:MAG: DNA recombination protein RmuC [Candidatus Margulisiibacteriota bacterium]
MLLDILHKTASDFVPTISLAKHLKVSQKSIQRDINELRKSFGIVIHQKKDRGVSLSKNAPLKLPVTGDIIELTKRELITLAIAQNYYQNNAPHVFEEESLSTFYKIVASLSPGQQESYKQYCEMVSFEFAEKMIVKDSKNHVLESLIEAIKDRKEISFVYQARYLLQDREKVSVPIRRKVNPLHLRYAFGGWYLVGYCHVRKEKRTFNLSQIEKLEFLAEAFSEEKVFKHQEYFAKNTRISSDLFSITQYLKEHVASVKNHIKLLSDKNYHALYQIDAPDFVLMFMPSSFWFGATSRSTAIQYGI